MDKLKRMKAEDRTSYAKAFNKLKLLLEEENPQYDGIEIAFRFFKQKDNKLENTHQAYLDIIDDEEFETEISTVESYREKSSEITFWAEKALGNLQRTQVNTEIVNAVSGRKDEDEYKMRPRLPEVQLQKFSGDLKEWLTFWNQFLKIHESKHLSNADKFHYLIQATEENSDPRQLIESFPVTNENYPLALKGLQERYGREDMLIEVYVRDLLKIVLNNSNIGKPQSSLSGLYNKLSTQLRALTTLGVTSEKCAVILFPLVESCLPLEILRDWERERIKLSAGDRGMNLDALLLFLKQEVESEERIKLARSEFALTEESDERFLKPISNSKDRRICTATELLSTQKSDNQMFCIFCKNKSHWSRYCKKAMSIPLEEKISSIKKNGLCLVCLDKGHIAKFCKSKIKCNTCTKGRHLRFLCPSLDKNKSKSVSGVSEEKNAMSKSVDTLHTYTPSNVHVFLQTLVVRLINNGKEKNVRLVLDSGSQKSYILKSTANELGYQSQGEQSLSHSLFGGAKTKEFKHQCYNIQLGSLGDDYVCSLDALDQDIICNEIPSINYGPWIDELKLKEIFISDVDDRNARPIEVLLGSDVLGRLYTGKREVLSTGLVALQTKLGWSLSGKVPCNHRKDNVSMSVISMLTKGNVPISNFWDLELIGIRDPVEQRSKEETKQAVIVQFQETVRVCEDGRYEANMPWKLNHAPLPDNYQMAMKRLTSTCKKLDKDELRERYNQVFIEWMNEGIIEEVPDTELTSNVHYLPHHPVIKESSTTSIRPVFDASAKTQNHVSLNDCLETRLNLIEKIPDILARFRRYRIGIISDIRKAFLQISLNQKERDFLRFLWFNEKSELKILRHTRVVFGVCCSPFLLGAVIEYHLQSQSSKTPKDSFTNAVLETLKDGFYVDNCVTSISSESNLEPFIKEATAIMKKGQFDLRAWETTVLDPGTVANPVKSNVLGLVWDKQADTLEITSNGLYFDENEKITKRKILSLVNKVFDPLGFVTPVMLQPKILLQSLWKEKQSWDTEVGEEVKEKFLKWTKELPYLNKIRIPRWVGVSNTSITSLHVFCDASQTAYASVVFIRCESNEGVTVQLLQANSRISPLKSITIPRLELLSATVGSRLYASVYNSLKLENIETFFWTDSSTVLAWIKRQEQWSVFVQNRVSEIRKLTPVENWAHIPGYHNAADLPSRGCRAKRLLELRWWEGPEWLKAPRELWPKSSVCIDEKEVVSEKRKTLISAKNMDMESVVGQLAKRISKLSKIIRVIAWILRFQPRERRNNSNITPEEYSRAQKVLLRCVQKESFAEEVEKRSLKNLSVYKDSEGILRMKTRLTDVDETEEYLTPLILPSRHIIVERLVEEHHVLHKHAGTLTLLTILRKEFWILKGRKTIRYILQRCIYCRRYQAKALTVPLPPLPKDRTSLSHTFQVTGVDLAGPLLTKNGNKYWVVIFTCAVYRAVHLEIVPAISTSAFVLALRRFISRRGRVSVIYSDNGTNFVGLNTALQRLDWEKIQKEFEVQKIKWKFNPPTSPWWGGFWERLIRILKDLLRKNLGRASLEIDELSTLICECESVMNSRPLTYVSEEAELRTLTPSMFLQSLSGNEVPELDIIDRTSLVKRWNYVQKLRSDLKQRFKKEYLGFLRSSNANRNDVIKVGDVVLVGSDDKKHLDWPLAVVEETFPGRDNIHRLVEVKTSKGVYLRPIQRLYPLELGEEDRKTHLNHHRTGERIDAIRKESPLHGTELSSTESRYPVMVQLMCLQGLL